MTRFIFQLLGQTGLNVKSSRRIYYIIIIDNNKIPRLIQITIGQFLDIVLKYIILVVLHNASYFIFLAISRWKLIESRF